MTTDGHSRRTVLSSIGAGAVVPVLTAGCTLPSTESADTTEHRLSVRFYRDEPQLVSVFVTDGSETPLRYVEEEMEPDTVIEDIRYNGDPTHLYVIVDETEAERIPYSFDCENGAPDVGIALEDDTIDAGYVCVE